MSRWREHPSIRGVMEFEKNGWRATTDARSDHPCRWNVWAKRGGAIVAAKGAGRDQREAKVQARKALDALITLEGQCPGIEYLLPDQPHTKEG